MRTLIIPGWGSLLLDVVVPEGVDDDDDDIHNNEDIPALIALD